MNCNKCNQTLYYTGGCNGEWEHTGSCNPIEKKVEPDWKKLALDAASFLASFQISGRFNQAENEWCNRVLRPINEAFADTFTKEQ